MSDFVILYVQSTLILILFLWHVVMFRVCHTVGTTHLLQPIMSCRVVISSEFNSTLLLSVVPLNSARTILDFFTRVLCVQEGHRRSCGLPPSWWRTVCAILRCLDGMFCVHDVTAHDPLIFLYVWCLKQAVHSS